jgi:hypothetical protein
MNAGTSNPGISPGIWVAALSGVFAVATVMIWPQQREITLRILTGAWCVLLFFSGPSQPGSLRLTPTQLHKKITSERYRSPWSFKLLVFATTILVVHTTVFAR